MNRQQLCKLEEKVKCWEQDLTQNRQQLLEHKLKEEEKKKRESEREKREEWGLE